MTATLRALRGATTLEADTREQVMERTTEMIRTLMERNDLAPDDLVSVVFTATDDVTAEFPAAAARELGISDVPLLCARELMIAGAVGLCIRVLMHVMTDKPRGDLRHVYLHGARMLRLDLPT